MKAGALLLDTCTCMWLMDDAYLRQEAVDAIDHASDRRESVYVSPITAWEVGNLARKGRFRSSYSPKRWLDALLARPGIAVAEMPPHVLLESALLSRDLNLDPGDRVVVATALEYGLTLLTRDADILRYARAGHMSALEC
ncbi:MAG TPA: type II toxin-antitoxin system VapC family toxin [Rhizomicrobium sp.]|nr:type II toxin-antitoxin system VapC family toxin [Rhizomicrobium sp.]